MAVREAESYDANLEHGDGGGPARLRRAGPRDYAGVADVPGKTMFEKKVYLETKGATCAKECCASHAISGGELQFNLAAHASKLTLGMFIMEQVEFRRCPAKYNLRGDGAAQHRNGARARADHKS